MMVIFYGVLALLLSGALLSLALGRKEQALFAACFAVAGASAAGFLLSSRLLLTNTSLSGFLPIPLPLGQCLFRLDPLCAVFLLPAFLISGLAAILLPSCMRNMRTAGGQPHYGRHGFFFCLLIAGMLLVLTAADTVFFLISWEIMSLVPFFLLGIQDKDGMERSAARIYLVAAHLGVLPLLLLFAMMAAESGATAFALPENGWSSPGLFFVLALLGFGVKTGIFPLHVWMPVSYPAATGHVAIVLSGALVNLGIYGLLRIMELAGPAQAWWAYTLMAVGAGTGLLGVLFSLAQPDMKRALAYSSMENMGVICLALGAGLLAALHQAEFAMCLFFGGALLHLWNHAVFKSLYFLGANAVNQSVGTTTIRMLGGLQKHMPFTGFCTAVASAAIAGTPPFNGFVSELLLYVGFVVGAATLSATEANLFFWAGLFSLAGIAGFSLFSFTRLYGLVFLGSARSPVVAQARETGRDLRVVMAVLAALCLLGALAAPWLFFSLEPVIARLAGMAGSAFASAAQGMEFIWLLLIFVSGGCALLLFVFALFALWRRRLVRRNSSTTADTWGCGYLFPSARIQYTGGSFAQMPTQFFRTFLRPRIRTPELDANGELFPQRAAADFEVPDWAMTCWRDGPFQEIGRLADFAKDAQGGIVNVYVLYILIALLAALVWAFWWL